MKSVITLTYNKKNVISKYLARVSSHVGSALDITQCANSNTTLQFQIPY